MIRTLGGSGRVLSEGQGEHSRRVRESTLGGSRRVLSEGQREHSQRVRESTLRESGRALTESQGEYSQRVRESTLGGSQSDAQMYGWFNVVLYLNEKSIGRKMAGAS